MMHSQLPAIPYINFELFSGGVGISNIIGKVDGDESMWFYDICDYKA